MLASTDVSLECSASLGETYSYIMNYMKSLIRGILFFFSVASSFTKTAPIYFHWIYTLGVVSLVDLRARNQVVIDWKPSLLLRKLH
uniref:Uncharacterized protein n=1 Tax=Picea glauca TaxID=3330 RepID=A0A101M4C3_PICGL|nr:hypothetical protein ABT39_MTgene481 [Picea glauca]QHR91248.1 hypothetical protein Q903MT_gene5280 [Picea sitchensis]